MAPGHLDHREAPRCPRSTVGGGEQSERVLEGEDHNLASCCTRCVGCLRATVELDGRRGPARGGPRVHHDRRRCSSQSTDAFVEQGERLDDLAVESHLPLGDVALEGDGPDIHRRAERPQLPGEPGSGCQVTGIARPVVTQRGVGVDDAIEVRTAGGHGVSSAGRRRLDAQASACGAITVRRRSGDARAHGRRRSL